MVGEEARGDLELAHLLELRLCRRLAVLDNKPMIASARVRCHRPLEGLDRVVDRSIAVRVHAHLIAATDHIIAELQEIGLVDVGEADVTRAGYT